MKYLLLIPFIICLALVLFGTGIFLAWVFGGMWVSDSLFTRAFMGTVMGVFGLFTILMLWIDE